MIKGTRVEVLPSYNGFLKCRTGVITGVGKDGCALVLLDGYKKIQHWNFTFLKKIEGPTLVPDK